MTDDDRAALVALLQSEIQQLWAAINALHQNQQNTHTNVMRLSHRLLVQEAVTAAEQMDDEGRITH